MTLKIGSLFSGYGGLEMALSRAFNSEVAWNSEIDPHASTILKGVNPTVPNLGDMTQINWEAVVPNDSFSVDILTGGYPRTMPAIQQSRQTRGRK